MHELTETEKGVVVNMPFNGENNRIEITLPWEVVADLYQRYPFCQHGHPLFGENLYEHGGRRWCKVCKNSHTLVNNERKGVKLGSRKGAALYCPNGHRMTVDNTAVTPAGVKRCRTCGEVVKSNTRPRAGWELLPVVKGRVTCPNGHTLDRRRKHCPVCEEISSLKRQYREMTASNEQRKPFYDWYTRDGLSYREIGTQYGISGQRVQQQVKRYVQVVDALAAIAIRLHELGEEVQ